MNIAIACDHGGFELKQAILSHLSERGDTHHDFGCFSADSIDYPDYAFPACEAVARGEYERGILICTTGIGMSICANKVRGIRGALCTNLHMAEMTRRHNDTNVLALGAHETEVSLALEIVDTWLDTAYEGGRHARRVGKIMEYEKNH